MAYFVQNIGTGTLGTQLVHTMNGNSNENVRITNTGNALVFLGAASVGTASGLPFGPGSELKLSNTVLPGTLPVAIYAMTGTQSGASNIGQLQVGTSVD